MVAFNPGGYYYSCVNVCQLSTREVHRWLLAGRAVRSRAHHFISSIPAISVCQRVRQALAVASVLLTLPGIRSTATSTPTTSRRVLSPPPGFGAEKHDDAADALVYSSLGWPGWHRAEKGELPSDPAVLQMSVRQLPF